MLEGVPQCLSQIRQLLGPLGTVYSTVQCTVKCTEQYTVHCTVKCSVQYRYVMCLVACEVVTSKSVKTKSPSVFSKWGYKTEPKFNNSTIRPGLVCCLGPGPFLQARALIPSQDVFYMSPTRPQGCVNIRI